MGLLLMSEKLPPPPRMPREWDASTETVREPAPNPDFYYMYDAELNGIATKRPPAFMR
jgi:hypothetical protein